MSYLLKIWDSMLVYNCNRLLRLQQNFMPIQALNFSLFNFNLVESFHFILSWEKLSGCWWPIAPVVLKTIPTSPTTLKRIYWPTDDLSSNIKNMVPSSKKAKEHSPSQSQWSSASTRASANWAIYLITFLVCRHQNKHVAWRQITNLKLNNKVSIKFW